MTKGIPNKLKHTILEELEFVVVLAVARDWITAKEARKCCQEKTNSDLVTVNNARGRILGKEWEGAGQGLNNSSSNHTLQWCPSHHCHNVCH